MGLMLQEIHLHTLQAVEVHHHSLKCYNLITLTHFNFFIIAMISYHSSHACCNCIMLFRACALAIKESLHTLQAVEVHHSITFMNKLLFPTFISLLI